MVGSGLVSGLVAAGYESKIVDLHKEYAGGSTTPSTIAAKMLAAIDRLQPMYAAMSNSTLPDTLCSDLHGPL